MDSVRPWKGGCSCGRNKYAIHIPQNTSQTAQVFFDHSYDHRKSQATPLSAWLKVPLSWYHSSTYSFFDDETHASIRRTYTSPRETHTKRQFCGFCGTPLTFWSEASPEEADYICLTLGSLASKDLRDLEETGLLPTEALESAENDKHKIESVIPYAGSLFSTPDSDGLPWLETMVEGSRLGRITRGHGEKRTGTSRYTIEWEIMEWDGNDKGSETPPGKRKLDEVDTQDDSVMQQ